MIWITERFFYIIKCQCQEDSSSNLSLKLWRILLLILAYGTWTDLENDWKEFLVNSHQLNNTSLSLCGLRWFGPTLRQWCWRLKTSEQQTMIESASTVLTLRSGTSTSGMSSIRIKESTPVKSTPTQSKRRKSTCMCKVRFLLGMHLWWCIFFLFIWLEFSKASRRNISLRRWRPEIMVVGNEEEPSGNI